MPTHSTYRYPPINIDSVLNSGGGTITIQLQRNALISKYRIAVVLGSLTGGSSPSWTVSQSNPILQNIQMIADNETIFNADTDMLQQLNYLFSHSTPNGLYFDVPMADYDVNNSEIVGTEFNSASRINNNLQIKIPPLSAVTSGSPTASSGTTLYLVEDQFLGKPPALVLVKKIQNVAVLQLQGDNDLTPSPFLTVDGAYKMVLYQVSSGGTLSDTAVNYVKTELNGKITLSDEYIATLKAKNQSIFRVEPQTGYFADVYMPDKDASHLLPLTNPSIVTSVKQVFNTSVANVQIKALKIEYMV